MEMARFHETYDVLITSPLGREPPLIEDAEPGTLDSRLAELMGSRVGSRLLRSTRFFDALIERQVDAEGRRLLHRTPLANLTGQPAMSIPLHRTPGGLPIGVHVLGRFGDERTLLQLAALLERAKPWSFEGIDPH